MRLRRRFAVPFVALAFALASRSASAQRLPPWRIEAEGGLTGILTAPQSDQYGLGGTGSVRFRLRMAGPLGLHVALGGSGWSAGGGRTATTSLIGGGIGVHFMPRLGPGYLLAEVGIGLGSSGAQWPGESMARIGLVMDAGVGYLVRATPSMDVGPVVRLADAHQLSGSSNTRSDLGFWSLGVTFSFHPAERVAPAPVAVSYTHLTLPTNREV